MKVEYAVGIAAVVFVCILLLWSMAARRPDYAVYPDLVGQCRLEMCDENGQCFFVRLYNITDLNNGLEDCSTLQELCTIMDKYNKENNITEISIRGYNFTANFVNIPCVWIPDEDTCFCEPYRWRDDISVSS